MQKGCRLLRSVFVDALKRLTNFLKITRIAVRAIVIARTAFVAVMLSTIKALIDVTERKKSRLCAAVWTIPKLFVIGHA